MWQKGCPLCPNSTSKPGMPPLDCPSPLGTYRLSVPAFSRIAVASISSPTLYIVRGSDNHPGERGGWGGLGLTVRNENRCKSYGKCCNRIQQRKIHVASSHQFVVANVKHTPSS